MDLVILGDFLDIWGVAPEEEKSARTSEEILVDLVEDDQQERAREAVEAHMATFESLGGFIAQQPERRRVVFVVGNHDHSLVRESVQEVIRNAVGGRASEMEGRMEFPLFYDSPELHTYAEHGNQYDANNRYRDFATFGEECPGYYFVRLVWNRLEPLAPSLDVWTESFRAIFKNKLWRLLDPAYCFYRQYRKDPRPFQRIDVAWVPFFAASGPFATTTGRPLPGFPDLLFSNFADPRRVFSTDRETEDMLRSLYHGAENRQFKEWVDGILKEKYGAEFPPVPGEPSQGVEFGLFQDENEWAAAGMFCEEDETPRTPLLRKAGLREGLYDTVIFGHTHKEKMVRLHRNTKYFNTGTWSALRDADGRNRSRLCYVKLTRREGGEVEATQQLWPLSERRAQAVVPRTFTFGAAPTRGAAEPNKDLLRFFSEHFKPGVIGLVGTGDLVGTAIREAQRPVTEDGASSLWSHAFILGEMRLDRRGPNRELTETPYLFESDLHVEVIQPQLRNGVQENWIGKWCKKSVEHAAIIDFQLSEEQTRLVLASALQMVDEQEAALYPVKELVGTWIAIILRRTWLPNPCDDPRAMYCSSFVRQCYREAQCDFLGESVAVSNTTPEHIARAGVAANRLVVYHG